MNGVRRVWPWLVLAFAGAALVLGLGELLRLRFARGDVFPPYSTLRADPLGAKAFFDGLDAAGIATTRHFRDLERNKPPGGTLFLCGVAWSDFADDDATWWKLLLERVEGGGRLVLTFAPTSPQDERFARTLKELRERPGPARPEKKKDGDDTGEKKPKDETAEKAVAITTRLGLKAEFLAARPEGRLVAERVAPDEALPAALPWHTALAFAPDDPAWRTLYTAGSHPAIIERPLGAGTIVLVGDAFLLSNEAMSRAREPALLAWLQGGARRAVFDESHLGVAEEHGVASLARRYGLAHTAFVLVALALLFIWRNAASLVPPVEAAEASAVAPGEFAGRESAAGFVSLLRRTLVPREFFAACLAEYRRSTAWRRADAAARRALEALATPEAARDPLVATRRAHEILTRKI